MPSHLLRLSAALFFIALSALAASPALAQLPEMPDCTGISDVSDHDGDLVSDFVGNLTTVRVAGGLTRLTFAVSPPPKPDGPDDRLFIVEQRGTVRILDLATKTLAGGFFLDIQGVVRDSGNEEGLLSLAFHPEYSTPGADNEGIFFVYYTNNSGNNQISRFAINTPTDANEASETQVLAISHPSFSNHNGGQLQFGPDGMLYAGTGDGGSGCDPFGAGQNLNDLRGKMLRLDVDSLPYGTAGNPFDGATPGADEIWSYGLRNPWRFSFDRETGALYTADVGQDELEEIDCQKSISTGGENYGWELFEGNTCPNPSCGGTAANCGTISHSKPILEYSHTLDGFSCSITGGYVYRGCRMTDLHGTYIYADYCSNQVRTFRTSAACNTSFQTLRTADLDPPGAQAISSITSFAEDSRGELYVIDRNGEVFKIVPELNILEVSGANGPAIEWSGGDMVWEDLEATSSHAISGYRVYRSDNGPTGVFSCVQLTAAAMWTGGDPAVPQPGELFHYLVNAINTSGQETRSGNASDGTPRTVDTNSSCP